MLTVADRRMLCGVVAGLVFSIEALASGSSSPEGPAIRVTVVDSAKQAVPGVQVQVKLGPNIVFTAVTDRKGQAEFTRLKPERYEIIAMKEGFEPVTKRGLDLSQGEISVELTLVPSLARQDSVEVRGAASPVEQGASSPNVVSAQTARELPSRAATVADALPLVPGVIRSPEGGLQISGSGEHRSSLIVNSADVTDPATGEFGLTVPIDSVETVNVYQTAFLAEYGRFTAGLVSVETRRGGEKWKWELNDPFPDFRIRSYQMRGLRDATPRLNVEGPLIPASCIFPKASNTRFARHRFTSCRFQTIKKYWKGLTRSPSSTGLSPPHS